MKTVLQVCFGGRENRWAIVQKLSINTSTRQISHSRKSDYSTEPVLLVRYDGQPPPSFRSRLMKLELNECCGGRENRWAVVQTLSISIIACQTCLPVGWFLLRVRVIKA
ncbi:MAG: hypothetical protein J0I84_19530 [Terrimonas sp.]|nr:hypothetical protein [Terrimonas sp.]